MLARFSSRTLRAWCPLIVALLAFFIFVGLRSFAPVFASPAVFSVVEMAGTWTVSGGSSQPLVAGDRLSAGAVLVNASPVSRDFITIANSRGEVIRAIRCKTNVCGECQTGGGCYDPIRPLPADASAAESALATTWQAVQELFSQKPDRYSLHRVRGDAFSVNRDAVLGMNGNTIDVSSLLLGQEKGDYELRCTAISRDTPPASAWNSESVKLEWTPGSQAIVAFAGLHPGLYSLRFTQDDSTSTAWILVTPAANSAEWNGRFEDFVHKTDSWGDSVSDATKRAYQRAYLDSLNAQLSGQPR
jgi:hypothetical protein